MSYVSLDARSRIILLAFFQDLTDNSMALLAHRRILIKIHGEWQITLVKLSPQAVMMVRNAGAKQSSWI